MPNKVLTVQMSTSISLYDNLGSGYGGKPFTDGMAANSNAPPPNSAQLPVGSITILVPSSPYTVSWAWISSPAGSTNLKTVKGASGDTGLTQSNGQSPMCIPVTAGGSFIIISQQNETVEIVYG